MHLTGFPDGDDGDRTEKEIWRYNYWEFSRIKDRYEASEWKIKIATQKKNCKQPKRKDITYKRMTIALIQTSH